MSVVVGHRSGERVLLACDTQLTGTVKSLDEGKIARVGPAIIGWTGSPLWGTFARGYAGPLNDRSQVELFAAEWWSWARERQHGDMSRQTYIIDGEFLIGIAGRLFEISCDGAVFEHRHYAAIGSGAGVALGALWMLRGDDNGDAIVRLAVEAAIAHAPACGGRVLIGGTNSDISEVP